MKRFLLLGAIAIALSGCVSEYPGGRGYDPYNDGYEARPFVAQRNGYRPRAAYRNDRRYYQDDRSSYRDYRPSYEEKRPNYRSVDRNVLNERPHSQPVAPVSQLPPQAPYEQPSGGNRLFGSRDDYQGDEIQQIRERRALYGDR